LEQGSSGGSPIPGSRRAPGALRGLGAAGDRRGRARPGRGGGAAPRRRRIVGIAARQRTEEDHRGGPGRGPGIARAGVELASDRETLRGASQFALACPPALNPPCPAPRGRSK